MIKAVFIAAIFLIAIGCVPTTPEKIQEQVEKETAMEQTAGETAKVAVQIEKKTEPDWKNMKLKNIKSDSTFSISDFRGKIVLLESFAVWCPKCKQQQDEFTKLRKDDRDILIVSLDTDPNEDEERVREHITRYGYDWNYAVSPPEYTKQLIDEFGLGIVSAPSAPVILICEDQSTRKLPSGVKDAATLRQEIAKGC